MNITTKADDYDETAHFCEQTLEIEMIFSWLFLVL